MDETSDQKPPSGSARASERDPLGGRLSVRGISGRAVVAICSALLLIFAAMTWFASQTKCATVDEPLHASSAYLATFFGDYRVDAEDPPLWKYWAMIPHRAADLFVERQGPYWDRMIREPKHQSIWAVAVLFKTTTIDGVAFIQRTRAMFVIAAVMVGVAIAWWSWKLAGAVGAIVATMLFAFDPTFLGHAPLVKNDVSITLVMVLFAIALWRCGTRLTVWNALGVSIALGAGLTVKYSGILLIPMLFVALLARVCLAERWRVSGRVLAHRRSKLAAAAGVLILAGAVSWVMIWAAYRFRFDASPDGGRLNTADIRRSIADNRFFLHHHRWPGAQEAEGWEWSLPARVMWFAERNRLLPQSWIAGFLFTYSSALVRPAYLLGRVYETGCWYYFPMAMLFKMPVATLIAIIVFSIATIVGKFFCAKPQAAGERDFTRQWALWSLWIPLVIYGLSAISTNLNLGIRHLLPIMPFVFMLMGLAASRLFAARHKLALLIVSITGAGLMIATVSAFPNFIAFFNIAAGGERGGIRLLADSNLDWGQDLPSLALWQEQNPGVPIFVVYFGRVDLESFGVRTAPAIDRPCVVAVSATMLQGIYLPPGQKDLFRPLLETKPAEVLGGTIYLYRYPQDFPDPTIAMEIQKLVQGWTTGTR